MLCQTTRSPPMYLCLVCSSCRMVEPTKQRRGNEANRTTPQYILSCCSGGKFDIRANLIHVACEGHTRTAHAACRMRHTVCMNTTQSMAESTCEHSSAKQASGCVQRCCLINTRACPSSQPGGQNNPLQLPTLQNATRRTLMQSKACGQTYSTYDFADCKHL